MSDRCRLEIRCSPKQMRFINQTFSYFPSDSSVRKGVAILNFDDVNYGGDSELRKLAALGIVFIAINYAGDNYGPGECVGIDRKLYIGPIDENLEVAVPLNADGQPKKQALRYAQRYLKLRKRALALIVKKAKRKKR